MFKYAEALEIAKRIKSELSPFCDKIEIAGSIRREKPMVKDIEIVCIPKTVAEDMFANNFVRLPGFINLVNQWEKVKGEPTGKYSQRIIQPEGIKLDLFMVVEDNWGFQLAIRTGSADYSHKKLGAAWVAKGYKSVKGMIRANRGNGDIIPIRTEKEFFRLIGLPYELPKYREWYE